MKLANRYLCFNRTGSGRFELAGCVELPKAEFGSRPGLIVWDTQGKRWFQVNKVESRSLLVFLKSNRVQYGEVPWGDGDADGLRRWVDCHTSTAHLKTPDEMAAAFETSGDTFTDFDRGEHRERVRDALILGLDVPAKVLACFPDLRPVR